MKYTFLAVYHEFDDPIYTMRLAQDFVLEEWRTNLEHGKVPYISDAKVSFKTYSFLKYPDQELLKNWVLANFTSSFGDLCFAGKVYENIYELIACLDKEKKLIELTVEVEE